MMDFEPTSQVRHVTRHLVQEPLVQRASRERVFVHGSPRDAQHPGFHRVWWHWGVPRTGLAAEVKCGEKCMDALFGRQEVQQLRSDLQKRHRKL